MEMNGNNLAWPAPGPHHQQSPGGQHHPHLASQGIGGQQMHLTIEKPGHTGEAGPHRRSRATPEKLGHTGEAGSHRRSQATLEKEGHNGSPQRKPTTEAAQFPGADDITA